MQKKRKRQVKMMKGCGRNLSTVMKTPSQEVSLRVSIFQFFFLKHLTSKNLCSRNNTVGMVAKSYMYGMKFYL